MKTPETIFDPKKPHIIIEGAVEYKLGTFDGSFIQYDFASIARYIDAKGKLLFGKNFKLYDEDKQLLYKLCSYFVADATECKKYDIDIDKGLLLTGPVGCGKTTLMRLLPHIVPHKRGYNFIPCRNIVFGFNGVGFKMIQDYEDHKSYCFDDLGVEHVGRYYGKDCNVMGEILISRYDIFKQKGIKTHITTNLNADELQEKYGERVRSRMREMFNLISFDENSVDKRK
ncbi:P-loop NTPase family protein [Nonlabens xiamenensis]|uniref:ATPase n=1 Tax=Nonlabens xiamenensis TaxID=2341043 RepID=UPI000F612130|nr:ATPase [Nonlabens xiamenensis]